MVEYLSEARVRWQGHCSGLRQPNESLLQILTYSKCIQDAAVIGGL